MMAYYASLTAAILIGIAGQILLKSGANGSATVVAQFLDPLTMVGLALYIMAAGCYVVALKKIPVSVASPRWRRAMRPWPSSHICCGMSLSAGRNWPASR